MIDLHCHLLPGIDDGPDTLEQSLELCRIAVADGTTHAVVTPHIHPGRWENNRASIAGQCESLQTALADNDIPLQLGFAAEVRLTEQLMKDASQLQPFIDLGCWLQITAGAVTGGFGDRAQAIAHQLLEEDVVTVMASDGHNARVRQPALQQAFNVVAQRYGEDRALQLVQHMPATIAADQFSGQVLPA
jgi:protein-tyrosine phosphatase